MHHENTNHKRAGKAVLMSHKSEIGLKTRNGTIKSAMSSRKKRERKERHPNGKIKESVFTLL
jgi:hypothetical protein